MTQKRTPEQHKIWLENKNKLRQAYIAEGRRRLVIRVKRNKQRRKDNWKSNHYGICPCCGHNKSDYWSY